MPGFFSAARLFLGKIPPTVWITIAIVVALLGGYFLHQHKASSMLAAEYARGASDRDKAWDKRLADEHNAAMAWKAKAEVAQGKISTEEGIRHEENLRDIDARARDQRLLGPGAAAAPHCGSSRAAGVPAAPAGDKPAARRDGASVAGMPATEGLAVVPWNDLVSLGAGNDAWRSEALIWREWYARQAEASAARQHP